jgi:NADPH-dependent 2,4-dienoyl-CoA reductase/sulfur reductase-like enzyme
MRTNVPHIYAIGDVTAKLMLAHVAEAQGVVAAETMSLGGYRMMPHATFCQPRSRALAEEFVDRIYLDEDVADEWRACIAAKRESRDRTHHHRGEPQARTRSRVRRRRLP